MALSVLFKLVRSYTCFNYPPLKQSWRTYSKVGWTFDDDDDDDDDDDVISILQISLDLIIGQLGGISFTCSKFTIETLEQAVKYVQS